LTIGEFRGSSKSSTLWTTKRAMQSFNTTRYLFGGPIPLGFAFTRPWEGGHRISISALCSALPSMQGKHLVAQKEID
jgi:hypothetical protein